MRARKVESPPRSEGQRSFDAPISDYSSALSGVPAKNYPSNYPIDQRTWSRDDARSREKNYAFFINDNRKHKSSPINQ